LNLGSTGAKSKPALDESSFQQLLAAAFVVQQHNEGLRAKDPAQATSGVLSEIAEIQSLVRAGGLEFAAAARLTSERLQKITRADAARILLIHNGLSECIAESGSALSPVSWLAEPANVWLERLRAGGLIQIADLSSDARLRNGSRENKVGSLIAAPVHCFDEFSGIIELRWIRPQAFEESAGRPAQLMAGLISGLLERKLRARGRSESAPPPNAGPETTEVEPIAEPLGAAANDFTEASQDWPMTPLAPQAPVAYEAGGVSDIEQEPGFNPAALPEECRVCGRPFGPHEAFCGQCSMPRVAGAHAEGLQSKWASLWYMQRAQAQKERLEALSPPPPAPADPPPALHPQSTAPAVPRETEAGVRIWHVPENKFSDRISESTFEIFTPETEATDIQVPDLEVSRINHRLDHAETQACARVAPAQSMAELQADPDLLQSTWQTVWARMRRRHATLALTAVGFLLLFLVLAVWPSSQNSQLTWFQSVLVELGLAEVPSHPRVFTGNPDARVWVDLHTALYYCQGSDLYGKTPGGHFSTQHEAQQDEFEPASQVPCP
jgi:hypothetical protein